MKIVLAPDSFKGSLSAKELCAAMRKGIERCSNNYNIIDKPLADGGEGTMENLVLATDGIIQHTTVCDPLGRMIKSSYGILGDRKTVVIEMALASGLPLLSEGERNPLKATSFGTGQLIKSALDEGYREFIIGLGGSATNDAGVGMLKALGARFHNSQGELLEKDNMEAFVGLSHIDATGLDPRIRESNFLIASDVQSPLCGETGASAVFGPQKGATPDMIEILDTALARFAQVVNSQGGIDPLLIPGAGAAGGMGAALLSFFDAKMVSGIDVYIEKVDLRKEIMDADLIITGEGKLDHQTLSGKVIAGVCSVARQYDVPVVALCGKNELTGNSMNELGLLAGLSITPGPCTLDEAFKYTEEWVADSSEQIIRLIGR
ncbi:glycerate kinase [Sutcliffiella sp. NPDC057660]|uniref:glycerate kinase family protein n=1 Tax=Sutcliffiella sp. NPDC057660 TaxID=3346199 RepID=UPI00367ED164